MIIGYARVSTREQHLDLQEAALKEVCCERIYIEKISAVAKSRPEWEACRNALREGDTLVVWRLDRLGRSLKDLVEIIQSLEADNIIFRSITESIDTTSASGKLIFHIFSSLAEFERNLIRERTIAGLAAARARGRKGGRKPKMDKATTKKAVAMLKDPLITKTEVAQHFDVTRATLNAALKRFNYPMNPANPDEAI